MRRHAKTLRRGHLCAELRARLGFPLGPFQLESAVEGIQKPISAQILPASLSPHVAEVYDFLPQSGLLVVGLCQCAVTGNSVRYCDVMTKGVHHHSLSVDDLPAAKRFYGELLGLPEIERPDLGIDGVWYQAGAVQLHIIELPESLRNPAPKADPTPLANHLAFEIDDYEATKTELDEAGLKVQALGPEAGQLFVQDPEGNMIEFIRPGGRSL